VRVECSVCCELGDDDGDISGFGVGPDQKLYVLERLGPKDDSWIDRKEACDWRVRCLGADGSQRVYLIRNQRRNYNLVQPVPDGLLLVGSRGKFAAEATVPNGYVFDLGGNPLRSMLLGDGIQDIQSTASGDIWVSYFDEGVFGNLGWNRPIGSAGLLRFGGGGDCVYRFQPVSGLDIIVDCYALNVTSADEAWCYYYTQFPIVQIQNNRPVGYWACPVSGASELAVWRDIVAMPAGYGATHWTTLKLSPSGKAEPGEVLEFVDNSGAVLPPHTATCRCDGIWLIQDRVVYRTALRDLKL